MRVVRVNSCHVGVPISHDKDDGKSISGDRLVRIGGVWSSCPRHPFSIPMWAAGPWVRVGIDGALQW